MFQPLAAGAGAALLLVVSASLAELLGGLLGMLVVRDLAANDLAVERERLEHDVQTLAVLVGKHEPKVEPKVVLAFSLDDCVGAMRRPSRLVFLRHGTLLWSGLRCPA